MFSEKTLAILQASGWSENRQIDITTYESVYKVNGFPIFPVALDFLRSFGGLRVNYPHPRAPQIRTGFSFEPDKIIANKGLFRIEIYGELLGIPLVVIGFQNDDLILLMDEGGKVYGGFEIMVFAVGDNAVEAVERLCESKVLPKLIDGDDV